MLVRKPLADSGDLVGRETAGQLGKPGLQRPGRAAGDPLRGVDKLDVDAETARVGSLIEQPDFALARGKLTV